MLSPTCGFPRSRATKAPRTIEFLEDTYCPSPTVVYIVDACTSKTGSTPITGTS